ncbi:hypothetical protein [Citrobacter sp. BDA59-3]|uniref:hypothetical protein n=1 Tax=Citrobacter sp. BDA59-3 TaxID=2781952 RepID=UPI001881DC12|nr:hypothetical protein [Citrobacter sp. BDA59-3]QOV67173.1 hypothetical protein IP582_16045 [Citrobacter sp. BDA59-3]
MKTLFNSIQVSKNHFIDTIENMIKNGDEIMLFGAGFIARITAEFMQRQNMPIDYVAVNSEHLLPGSEINCHPVTSLEKLEAQGKRYNYIVAIQFYTVVFIAGYALPQMKCFFMIACLSALMQMKFTLLNG